MAEKKEEKKQVIIELTKEQREKIKGVTGQEINKLKVEAVEDRANPMSFSGYEF